MRAKSAAFTVTLPVTGRPAAAKPTMGCPVERLVIRLGREAKGTQCMDTGLMFSHATDVWGTPQWLFDSLDKEFGFTLDPCSDGTNAMCANFYSIHDSGMLKDWGTETVFMNPPYSQCEEWMRKAYGAAQGGATVVCLVPARTDTEWWHRYAMKGEVRLLKGRLKFGDAANSAPFPSAIVVFRPREFVLTAWDARDV